MGLELYECVSELERASYIHTSIVQYPQALNPRILPPEMKKQLTLKWDKWLENIEDNLTKNLQPNIDIEMQIASAKRYGNQVMRYMNSKDEYKDWDKFVDYTKILDQHHNTNILDVYPEFKMYWI